MIVGLLGILKAGGAYVPLNFEHPPARLGHQLQRDRRGCDRHAGGLLHRLPAFDGDVVCLDRDREALDAEPDTAPADSVLARRSRLRDLHVGLDRDAEGRRRDEREPRQLRPLDRSHASGRTPGRSRSGWSPRSPPTSATPRCSPLSATAARSCSVSPAAAADGAAAAAFLQAHPIDVLKITPSHLNALLVGADAARVLPRKWLVVGGEALSWDLVARVRELGECRILNHFGPTETTVGSCTFRSTRAELGHRDGDRADRIADREHGVLRARRASAAAFPRASPASSSSAAPASRAATWGVPT